MRKLLAVSLFIVASWFAGPVAFAQNVQDRITVPNAGVTGTTLNKLAKLIGSPSTAVLPATTDTGQIVGIVVGAAGTTGTATIQVSGITPCVFDGATTANDYVQNSTTSAGSCHDVGTTFPNSGQVLGRVLTTNGIAGTYNLDLFPAEIQAVAASCNPMTTLGDMIYGGVFGVCARLAPAATPNGVPQIPTQIPAAGAATAEAFQLPGVTVRSVVSSGTTDTILSTDCNPKRVQYTGSTAQAVTLPTATTLAVPACVLRIANNTTSTVTVTPTSWTLSAGSTTGLTSLAISSNEQATFYVDPGGSAWDVDLVSELQTCNIIIGADNGIVALADLDIGPQGRQCKVPSTGTILEVTVAADAGTPSVILDNNHAGTPTNILSMALPTAASGGLACANVGGTVGLDGVTTCSAYLENTTILAGDWLETLSGTAGGTAKRMSIAVTWTVN